MRHCAVALACLVLPCAAVHAQTPALAATPDPMESVECKRARETLEAAFRAATDRRDDTALKLQAARRNAALVCLGRRSPAPPQGTPSNRAPAAQAVPPVMPDRSAPLPTVPRAAPPSPPPGPVTVPRPTLITNCDDAGCWGNDGRRYNRAGSQLIGPNGSCSVQGNVVNCP